MKNTYLSKLVTMLLLLSKMSSQSAITRMNLTYPVFMNTANSLYPSVNFGSGTPANFSFQYDAATMPYFSGSVVIDSNGNPVFDSNGLVYNTTVLPESSMSNESRYNIIGNISLEIAGQKWTGSNYNLLVYNNFPTLSPYDGMIFEFNLNPQSPFLETLHNVQLSFSSNSLALSLFRNTALPTQNSDIDGNDLGTASFDISPQGGGWFINSGSLSNISVSTIPEISSFFIIGITTILGSLRRSRN